MKSTSSPVYNRRHIIIDDLESSLLSNGAWNETIKQFMANPVVLSGHDCNKTPVGKCLGFYFLKEASSNKEFLSVEIELLGDVTIGKESFISYGYLPIVVDKNKMKMGHLK